MVEKPQKVNKQPKQKAPHTKKVSAFAVLFAIIGLRKFAKPAPTSASTKSNAP